MFFLLHLVSYVYIGLLHSRRTPFSVDLGNIPCPHTAHAKKTYIPCPIPYHKPKT
jgi:hypothetical protein